MKAFDKRGRIAMADRDADQTHAQSRTYGGRRHIGYPVGDPARRERIEQGDPSGKGWFPER
jgi:hypothetical protein